MEHLHRLRSARRGLLGTQLLVLMAALALCAVPLFDSLGFEFAAAIGWLLAYVAGWRATGAAVQARLRRPEDVTGGPIPAPGASLGFPGGALLRCAAENLTLAATPLLVMAARSLWVPACNWTQGLRFYALLPLPGALYGTALGFALGLALPVRRARLAFVGWSLLTYAIAIWRLLVEPPKFAFNAFVGYFPGPIYDSEVAITPALLLARTLVVAQALLVLGIAVLAWERGRLRPARLLRVPRGERAVVTLFCTVLCIGLLLAWRYSAPLGISIDRSFIQRSLGGVVETAHFHVYYDRTAMTAARAQTLAAEHECRFAQLTEFFGFTPPRKIGSYVYGSAAQKKRLMGAAGTSFEDAWSDEFHINASSEDPHPTLTHEMAHIFAAHLVRHVPVCWKIGLHEGIAVAAEWNEESARLELTPDQACVAMDSLRLAPDLSRSLSAIGFWTQSGSRVYTACGSFVHFLLAHGGMERFRVLWPRGDFETAYGKPLHALLEEWHTMLRATSIGSADLRRAERLYRAPGIFQQPCAHEVARLESQAAAASASGDCAAAVQSETRLVDLDPENPERRLALAGTRARCGDWAGARAAAAAVLDEERAGPAAHERAWRLQGDADWGAHEFAAAERAYACAALLAGSAADRRAYEVRRAVLGDPRLAGELRAYLCAPSGDVARELAILYSARAGAPESPWPSYLLGRRLVLEGAPLQGASELRSALATPGLGPEASVAAWELLGRAELAAGRPAAAIEAFGHLVGSRPGATPRAGLHEGLQPVVNQGRELGFADWLQRARWAAEAPRTTPTEASTPSGTP